VQLFAALLAGCVHLVHLDVSRCVYSNKKLTRDVAVPMSWKDFFERAAALQTVSFAGCRLPSEAVKYVAAISLLYYSLDIMLPLHFFSTVSSDICSSFVSFLINYIGQVNWWI